MLGKCPVAADIVKDLFIYLFIYLIDTTLKLIIMGLPGEWKEHESFKERDMNVVE